MVQQVTKCVPEAAEQHDAMVWQFLLFNNDATERLQFGSSGSSCLGLIQHLPNLVSILVSIVSRLCAGM